MRQMRKKMSIREFEPLSIIGRGAFGEVRVCRQKETGSIVAVKKMRKEDMIKKNQLMHVRTEKEILTADNPWIVKLKYSFQDDYFLYLVMDYCPGGDLMNLLMKKDILTEDEARFYTAEMILAVDSVHKLNCIHRDLKPDNILIDKRGHVQLSDFGLSKLSDKTFFPISIKDNSTTFSLLNNKEEITNHEPSKSSTPLDTKKPLKKKNRLMAFSTVGTPDYIAPEVFGNDGYGQEVDWWSIGVMFFEMVVGYPPFFSENPSDTCKKIVKWKQYFQIPDDAELSNEAKSLIKKMVCSHENRLGVNGVDEIKKHPFFKGIDWDNLRNVKAPFIPDIENDWDNKYFDKFLEQESFYPPEEKKKKRKDVNYAGYTFNRDNENMKDGFVQALEILEVVKKSIKDKKGNNDDDDDEEKNNEKEKDKDKNNEEDKDKEDDKSIEDIILNDQDDEIEDEKEKKKGKWK
jgi:serine/threonine kinase 38